MSCAGPGGRARHSRRTLQELDTDDDAAAIAEGVEDGLASAAELGHRGAACDIGGQRRRRGSGAGRARIAQLVVGPERLRAMAVVVQRTGSGVERRAVARHTVELLGPPEQQLNATRVPQLAGTRR